MRAAPLPYQLPYLTKIFSPAKHLLLPLFIDFHMPVYEYSCQSSECLTYEVWRSIDQRSVQTECPTCGREGKRIFNPPMVLSSSIRSKIEVKEPKLVSKKNSIYATEASKPRLRTNDSRPWMLNRGC